MCDAQTMPPIMGGSPDIVDRQVAQSEDDADQVVSTFRWTDVNIPGGATITVANMDIYLPDDGDDFFDGKTLYAENNNNPGPFTTDASNISNRTFTTASVALGTGAQGTGWKTLPSMVDLVQEVVTDQGGTGDAFVAIIKSTKSDDLEIMTQNPHRILGGGARMEASPIHGRATHS